VYRTYTFKVTIVSSALEYQPFSLAI